MDVDFDELSDAEEAIKLQKEVIARFPDVADKSRQTVIDYLEKYDPKRLSLYLGYFNPEISEIDRSMERLELQESQFFICGLLRDVAAGNPSATPLMIDIFIRKYLFLPPPVIKGGKA